MPGGTPGNPSNASAMGRDKNSDSGPQTASDIDCGAALAASGSGIIKIVTIPSAINPAMQR